MQIETKKDGKIITFYSYKGGTGRSMALSNVAVLMAQGGKKVLMIDWDLEAPGLPKYFKNYLPKDFDERKGLIDFFEKAEKDLPEIPFESVGEKKMDEFFSQTSRFFIPIQTPKTEQNLFLIKAGRENEEDYVDQIGEFSWEGFFKKRPSFFSKWAGWLSEQFDFVLIDSRTGHTDTGGICTMQMPDKLVLVFTPNQQSFMGISKLAMKAVRYRQHSHDLRPLMVYPLPSRIELDEDELRRKWLLNYKDEITQLFRDLYDLPEISVENYVNRIQIRHASSYAYEEKVAVIVEENVADRNSLTAVYRDFLNLLVGDLPIWMFGQNGKHHQPPLKMFVIYAREDLNYLDLLKKHLAPLQRSGKVDIWSDQNISAGSQWEMEINKALNEANIILILISIDALNSEFIWQREVSTALQRFEKDGVFIFPILLRHCAWQNTPLSEFQFLPNNSRGQLLPVSSWENLDEAFTVVVSEISKVID